jgi:glyoxylase-like metal-dependent hydrolase (beta-lactamase superfamily II)
MATKESDTMKIYKEVFSPIQVNTYIVEGDAGGCIIIDCGCYGRAEEKRLEAFLTARSLSPQLLLNTHCHLDHIFGNSFMLERYGLRSWFHAGDSSNHASAAKHAIMFGLAMEEPPAPAGFLPDGEVVTAAGISFEVIAVAGHSPGGISFYSEKDGVIFTGDALFAGSIGRSDLPGGDHEQLMTNIRTRLFTLPPDTLVYAGHGPETTIREEMKSNPFFV